MKHEPNCQWERTTKAECEFRETHHYCPHQEHACTCPEEVLKEQLTKSEAILKAIRNGSVGSDIIINNKDGSVYCILTIKCKEHPEQT